MLIDRLKPKKIIIIKKKVSSNLKSKGKIHHNMITESLVIFQSNTQKKKKKKRKEKEKS
jgi:hypothetical protein